ncbi:DNA replication factor Dna2 [Halosimplex carlsbadense 2-9-1]|uniref:DNA helicase n=1 Tax=Halosimplex carlsbadense 2-9-1 TaxID=797114 RepID=M0CNV4_9EURY|nr:AAA domain-containing protein [Halosimplex carlsbadense]ELZ24926.1 DNA replication factor Dna2 [Halosimplex carlsbadense 2-9-1]
MTIRGVVVDVSDPKTVSTQYGESELVEVSLRPDRGRGEPTTVTLWNKWTETATYLEAGMELAVTDPEEREYRGEQQFSTTGDSMVVVEPDFLVDVTDVRSWVQCPRMYYLNKIGGVPNAYPVVKGTIVHEVFGDLLRGRDLDESIDERVEEAGLELGMLGRSADEVREEVRQNASAIEGWLQQGTLTDQDEWRSEMTLVSETYGLKGRADAVRRGMPVELKTGKNTKREPRFHDKVQATCYALILGERRGEPPDTGTLLYTKNAAVERNEESGDLSPAKEFSIGSGFLKFVLRTRNALAAMEYGVDVPTGYEADAKCEYCFEQDTCMAVSGRLGQESKAGVVGSPVPDEEREYFDRVYESIERERRAVHREYAKLWEQSPEERAEDDRALVDLEPTERRELDGGTWELRARGTGAVSKIREGDLVLASDGDPIRGEAELARVERLGGGADDPESDEKGPEVVVTADEPVELRRLDVYPSELSTDRMLTALHDAVLTQSPEEKDVLFGRREPEFGEVEETFVPNNDAQNEAVELAVGCEDCALIHGPPGTGKTYTLAHIVQALVDRDERVLLSAFTNRAVDNALEALVEQGFTDFVRVGTESGVRADMQDYRLERAGDPDERVAELRDAQVVAATTATCGSRIMREQDFDAAVVDEAGQLTEPGTLAATNLAERFVLVGDHQQLPPVVQADEPDTADLPTGDDGNPAPGATLSRSLFQRLIERYPEASVMLDRQYRMAQRIQAFASREFYDGQLRPATGEVAGQHLSQLDGVDVDALPVHLRDQVAFVDPDGTARGNTNPVEAETVAETVAAYREAGVPAGEIGVIAPFRAQVAEIGKHVPDAVAVDTVDRFQGSSKEVIVISFVATGSLDSPIFEDYRRVNVGLTRAKKALVLVGDADALGTDDTYGRMVEWAR